MLPSRLEYRIITKIDMLSPKGWLRPGWGVAVNYSRKEGVALLETLMSFIQEEIPFVTTIRIFDLIDIAILSVAIYQLLWIMRKSSSGRVIKGVLVLIVAIAAADWLQLTATSWVLNWVVEWGILALVILFQPEIRRVLERLGSGKLSSMFSSQRPASPYDMETAIRETVEAYTSMSKDKVGALMVFERKNLLDDVIKTGTPLDCSVSSELLKNLFWNKAPLHDGAVIVREGRIVGAGCMLPLSGNVNLSRDLGMRHRAGIGMSEHSDAVVVIVSEETGSISAAMGGMLKRHLAPETLERLLRNELLPEEAEEEKNLNLSGLLSNLISRGKKEGEE